MTTREQQARTALEKLMRQAADFADSWSIDRQEAWVAAIADMVRHEEDRTHSFGSSTPVPAWARREFDGRMRTGECPILSLGTVTDHVEWPRIVREHQVQLVNGYYETPPHGPAILAAYEHLTGLGYQPWMETEIHLTGVADDGTLQFQLEAGALYVEGPLPDRTVHRVSAELGELAVLNPTIGDAYGRSNVTEWAWY
ncbi:hypothetical protein DR950_41855 [Kitasatospora xanthocidica]|uniref:Uncharacterized protein n=1 Tax=Kitasatospora xanthocidica TaxID=83382 RepID=A0A372ZI35_9ACTN|nr:hypothetical protein [Kitasatospora xanthocidica]RGD55411.1 hypothetical protein DR950_41855 [Kitasatospora xanthocidica]